MNILPGQPLSQAAAGAAPVAQQQPPPPVDRRVDPPLDGATARASAYAAYAVVAALRPRAHPTTSTQDTAAPPKAPRQAAAALALLDDALAWGIVGAALWLLSLALPWWVITTQIDSARAVGEPFSISSRGASLGFGKWAIAAGLGVLVLLVAHRVLAWSRRWASLGAAAPLLLVLCWRWWPSDRGGSPQSLDIGNPVVDSLGLTTQITNSPGAGMWLALAGACLIVGGAALAAIHRAKP